MKIKPLVSVIIPTYNSARFVTKAIDSVLKQSYKNYEIIVVDDGSTDDTKNVLKSYIKKKKIRYICEENRKQAAARNNGIRHSKGELIAFLDADDLWLPNKLELQVPLFDDEGVGLVYGDISLFDEKSIKPGIHINEFVKGRIFRGLVMTNFICASSTIVRKDCIDKVGLFKEGINFFGVEDYHMWLRISYYFKSDFVPDEVVKYRVHSSNVSDDYCEIVRKEAIVRNDICGILDMSKKLKKDCLFKSYNKLSYYSIEYRRYRKALKALLKAFSLKPFNYKNYKLLVKLMLWKLIK